MLNKKILATAVAVAFSSSALADIDLTDNNTNDRVNVGTEALIAADFNGDGFVVMNNVASNGISDAALDVQSVLGFSIGEGTSKYIRIDLAGAEFGAAPVLTVAGTNVTLAQGGNGQSFAIFEVAAPNGGGNIAAATSVILETDTYLVNPAGGSSVTVATYEDASNAVNETGVLFTDSKAFTNVASVVTGDITNTATSVATVGSNFLLFTTASGDAFSTTVAKVGEVDLQDYVLNGSVDNDLNPITVTDVLTANQAVAVSGDFSFGTWTLDADLDCDPANGNSVALTVNSDETVATSGVIAGLATTPLAVCVTVPGVTPTADTIQKGNYSVEILEDEIEGNLGGIVYNTVSIDVPYITTFADYNQRLYIVNNGRQDALYTMTFTGEDGTEVTPGTAATGTVPAGEMVTLKATDVVTLSGKTRVSAVIEIEAEDSDITAASQSVNKATGGTDTVVLN